MQVVLDELENAGEGLHFFIEEALGALMGELYDRIGLSVVQGLGVLGFKHIQHCLNQGHEGEACASAGFLTVIEELVNRLDACFFHLISREADRLR